MHQQNQPADNLIWRRFSGPLADEIHIQCRIDAHDKEETARRTVLMYHALDSLLRRGKGSLEQIVYETVFFRNIRRDLEKFQRSRLQAFQEAGCGRKQPACTFIEQPPLDPESDLAVSAVAVIPHRDLAEDRSLAGAAIGRLFVMGSLKHFYAGSICGQPGPAFDQAYSMFCRADEMLAAEGMNFGNVVRTWIYLREMERDYGDFNRARRTFFREQNIDLLPASTGISGSPFPEKADFTMSFCAVQSEQPVETTAMTTPTLNEACTYGSDFSRGMRVVEENKIVLYVSGTASVDEEGRTAHLDDFGGQVERMLLNIETLLAAQNATFADVLSAVTYLKSAGDAPTLRRTLRARGLDKMPNLAVRAAVCRPDLLCEMEAIAAIGTRNSAG